MIVLDLYCGLGGWATGFLETGNRVIGYDIADFRNEYPGWFIKTDLLTFSNFPHAEVIVASPPCTDFSKASFPKTWKSVQRYPPDLESAKRLFYRVYQIVDLVKPSYYIIENVRGAQEYVGKAKMHIGSRYFWGNFPLFMVEDRNDIYGKWKMSSSENRSALRSKIPLSISHAFSNKIMEILKYG